MVAWTPTQYLAPVSWVFRECNWMCILWSLPRCSQPGSSCWVGSIMWCVVLTRLWLDSVIVVQLLSRIWIFGQHARLSCPLLSPRVCSDSCLLSWWCHQPPHPLSSPSPPTFSLSQCQGLFQWVGSSHQVAKVLELHLQHQSFQWIFKVDFL